MKKNQFSIVFKGFSDDEHLRLTDFVQQLDAFKNILQHIDLSITQGGKESTYYRVVDLSHSSPTSLTIEAVPISAYDNTVKIIDKFFEGIRHIKNGKMPNDYNHPLIESLKKIGSTRIKEVILNRDKESIKLDKKLSLNIDEILGEDEIVEESMTGTLEMLNLHTSRQMFRLYPVIGAKKIDCFFPPSLLKKVIHSVNRYVNVDGKFRYKQYFRFPYSADAIDIDIYPEENELPHLLDLRGIAPNATKNMGSEEFIRRNRDNDW